MDAIRVPRVDDVLLDRSGKKVEGSLHLTPHHLIFHPKEGGEAWTPYPIICLVNRLPQTLHGVSPLLIRTRTFESLVLSFKRDKDAEDVFLTVRELTVASSVEQLYAFDYTPSPPFEHNDGWHVYNPREEFARMGLGTRTKAWRFTDINKDYQYSPTYPAKLVVPAKISDAVLAHAGKYRSKARIPALSYLHWANHASITRCSQPLVGLKNARSAQDERLVDSIFHSHISPNTAYSPAIGELDPAALPRTPVSFNHQLPTSSSSPAANIYGATATNLIVDARPTANAVANMAKGAGTESMENYKAARKVYLGIDNIHVMRNSLNALVEVLRDGEVAPGGMLDRHALRRSGWLKHISALLEGSLLIIRNIHINSSHVLIHCSDGWDRTSQLSALSELCLDPFYRTIKGFQVLIEKEWLAFGYKFLDRSGHLSSEKLFTVATAGEEDEDGDDPTGGAGRAARAFLGAFQKQFASNAHVKETSPVFHQFLDCVRQLQRQFPTRFEFNGQYLETLHYHLYACQFGTFLFNNERQRRVSVEEEEVFANPIPPWERTKSVWDFLRSSDQQPKFINSEYDPSLDDVKKTGPDSDMGVLLPNPKDVRYWHELFRRSDEEMNGPPRPVRIEPLPGADIIGPIATDESDPAVDPGMRNVVKSTVTAAAPALDSSVVASSNIPAHVLDRTGRVERSEDARNRLGYTDGARGVYPTNSGSSSPVRAPVRQQSKPTPPGASSGGWGWSQLGNGALSVGSGAFTAIQGAAREIKSLGAEALSQLNAEGRPEETGEMWERPTGTSELQSRPGPSLQQRRVPSEVNPWQSTRGGHSLRAPSEQNPWSLESRVTETETEEAASSLRGLTLATAAQPPPTQSAPAQFPAQLPTSSAGQAFQQQTPTPSTHSWQSPLADPLPISSRSAGLGPTSSPAPKPARASPKPQEQSEPSSTAGKSWDPLGVL